MNTLLLSSGSTDLSVYFTNMIGTLAVILVVSAFVGGSDLLSKFKGGKLNWKYALVAGVLGGVFGIYGNLSGIKLNGAIISVRDVGPMLAGITGGPIGGLFAGVIAGVHRILIGGSEPTARMITASCVIATVTIGTMCGLLSLKFREKLVKPWWAAAVGIVMELYHLGLLLIIVKPFETAFGIVKAIALPFVLVNALGFTLMIAMINYIERQRTISIERSRLKSELDAARVIQHSLLPPINDKYPGRKEISLAAFMEPAKQVGGDFYDFFFVDRDRMAFLIADVSGKGIPAALFMATAKLTLQNCLRDCDTLAEAVQTANNALCAQNEAEMFVTSWIGVLDITTGVLTSVSAGHNPPVLISADGSEPVFLRRKRNGFVLAGMEDVRYREESIELKKGDRIFLYTDGVTEAENISHDLFGEERLQKTLAELNEKSPEDIVAGVKSAIDAHVGKADQFDDITMLCVKLN